MFSELARRGDLEGVREILEFGSQQLGVKDTDNPQGLYDFYDAFGIPRPDGEELLALHGAHVGKVFKAAGFEYTSLDVNGEGGSKQFDCNFDSVREEDKNKYDLVTNQGTIEHTFNIANDLMRHSKYRCRENIWRA